MLDNERNAFSKDAVFSEEVASWTKVVTNYLTLLLKRLRDLMSELKKERTSRQHEETASISTMSSAQWSASLFTF